MRVASKLERKSSKIEPKSKYYIIPEGDKTELDYFLGVKYSLEELNINLLIEIILLENEDCEFGHSHPLKKIENFNKDINDEKFTYDSQIDKVCFIVDRDPQNFKKNQYEIFLGSCNEKGYNAYVSNPTFELFLIMHSDKIFEFDRRELLKNSKVNKNKRYLEILLFDIFGCNKKNIDFNKFKENIDKAIYNEKKFCEELELLEYELGSNVGKLLEKMRFKS